MSFQYKFKRYELKYKISLEQRDELISYIQSYMDKDVFHQSIIRNLYFDTDQYRLIRNSLDKPIYKEKLRIRTYHKCHQDALVFVELKKKYDGVVYKRRISLSYADALNWLIQRISPPTSQIVNEINYVLDYYQDLKPKLFLSYERLSFKDKETDLRITFDNHITYRDDDLSLEHDIYGKQLLDDEVIMEIKTSSSLPLWLTKYLSSHHIYKTPFSKYGYIYKKEKYNA